ncbi:hypothetical protein PK28_04920 [Hymenobacter sp. DG25B]|nr:hypothetical protein PK28_04920 [Hymenobacter sp. DG25B]
MIDTYLKSNKSKNKYRSLNNKIKEGQHYIFVYSTGDNIVHLDFENNNLLDNISSKVPVKFLCGKAMVIIDDDNNKNTDRKKALKEKLKFNLLVLNVTEVENLLSPDVIIKTIKDYPSIKKHQMISIPEFKQEDYKYIKLGTYIDDNLLPKLKKINKKETIKTKSFKKDKTSTNSTINNKVEFCEYATMHINESNLSTESIRVIESILDFIIKNNPNI